MSFPLTAAIVGVAALGARPTVSQWVGFIVVLASVIGLALHEQRSPRPAVAVPNDAREALGGAAPAIRV